MCPRNPVLGMRIMICISLMSNTEQSALSKVFRMFCRNGGETAFGAGPSLER